jgi:hypothetical protein
MTSNSTAGHRLAARCRRMSRCWGRLSAPSTRTPAETVVDQVPGDPDVVDLLESTASKDTSGMDAAMNTSFRKIAVPLDGARSSERALPFARALGRLATGSSSSSARGLADAGAALGRPADGRTGAGQSGLGRVEDLAKTIVEATTRHSGTSWPCRRGQDPRWVDGCWGVSPTTSCARERCHVVVSSAAPPRFSPLACQGAGPAPAQFIGTEDE